MEIGKILFRGEYLSILEDRYKANNRLAVTIKMEGGSPFGTLSSNIVDAELPDEDCFFVKNWSENADLAFAIQEAGIFDEVNIPPQPTGRVAAPIWRVRRYVWVVMANHEPIRVFKSPEGAHKFVMALTMSSLTSIKKVQLNN